MARNISSRFEDLDLSRDEVERLGNALKKEEFRELLFEYAREINDPANKKQYEEEITQLENERGVDIKFVHPEPQYVLKTCFNPGGGKVFVNICSNLVVGKPTSKPCVDSKGVSGINWSVPLTQAPPREDLDKTGLLCTVYDVVFHPDTHALAAKDRRFRNFVEETALNAVEESYSVKLDRNSIKRPRMKFKGCPHSTVIRTRRPEVDTDKGADDDFLNQFPYPYKIPPKEVPPVRELKQKNACMEPKKENGPKQSYITPKYEIKQSSDVDMTNYEQNHLSHHDITVPQRLVLLVDLPYVKSSAELELDLEVQKVTLVSKGKRRYKLELKLPYPVQEAKGNAKFDQEAGKLLVTILVDREKAVMKKPNTPEGDSGIESDMGYGRVSSGEEEESKASEKASVATRSSQVGEDNSVNSTGKINQGEIREDSLTLSDECLMGDIGNAFDEKDVGKMFEMGASEAKLEEELLKNGSLEEELDDYSKKSGNDRESEDNAMITPKVQLIQKIEEKTSLESEENIEPSVSINSNKERINTGKDLLQSGIPYMMPLFSCSCQREQESASITFIIQVKNVDPSSIQKKVNCVTGIHMQKSESEAKVNGLSNVVSGNGAFSSENGSVCNEYRTVEESGSPLPISNQSVNGASVTKDNSSGNESGHPSRPADTCTKEVNSSSVLPSKEIGEGSDSKSVLNDSSKGISSCVTSQLLENFTSKNAVGVPGANLSLSNEIVEEKLRNNLKRSLVIKEEDSAIRKTQEENGLVVGNQEVTCFHVTFSSIGAGFFPIHYTFCMGFPTSQWPNVDSESLDCSPISIEVWDNNVEVQWMKPCSKNDTLGAFDCFVGQDPGSLQSYKLPPFEDKETESESFSEPVTSVSEDRKYEETKRESDASGASNENNECQNDPMASTAQRRKMFKERALSESSVESSTTKQVTKGILKRRGRVCLGRSLSESSGGEEYSWVAAAPLSSAVSSSSLSDVNRFTLGECLKEEEEEYDEEEEDDDEDGEKVKKIVRFSDVISQKTYRSNSSILGQRKKNQRKLRNKKRAAERRASESENSVDEVETGSDKSNSLFVTDSSPPQKAEIPLPADISTSKGKVNGAAKKKGGGSKGKGKKVDAPHKADDSSENAPAPQYEFKSDLIFQLEL